MLVQQHPQVFSPRSKSRASSSRAIGAVFTTGRPISSCFRGAAGCTASASIDAYLASPESPAWIRRCLGDVRIIVSAAQSIERAWSMSAWMVMEGYEGISYLLKRSTEKRTP